jgi:CBS domain-containing protein
MAKSARDIMSDDCTCIGENDTVLDAAKRLAELDVGALPICGEDDRLKGMLTEGMLTDRDIVVKVLAQGRDPASTRAGELGAGDGETITIGADDSVDEALATMAQHQVRRLPVIDGHRLVGIVSQADIARNIEDDKVGDLVQAISQ